MFEDDMATYVSLNWLEISKFPLNMMFHTLVDYTYPKNEPSEHIGSGEMGIGANCVNIRIFRKNC
jgi:hypothetical protein